MGDILVAILKALWWLIWNWLILPITLFNLLFPNGEPDGVFLGLLWLVLGIVSLGLVLLQGSILLYAMATAFTKYIDYREKRRPKFCSQCRTRIPEAGMCAQCKKLQEEKYREEMKNKFRASLSQAKQFETAGRFEEAARIYEEFAGGAFGYFKPDPNWLTEAGRVRRLSRTEYVRTSIVNVNTLIPQLKELVNYKCPNCGAGIGITSNTSEDNLKFCSHCGSALNINLISEYLQKLL